MPLDPITIVTRSCDPNLPLPLGDKRYVSLAEARGETSIAPMGWCEILARDIRRFKNPTTFLVAGFAGDGKSTEFLRLQHDLQCTHRILNDSMHRRMLLNLCIISYSNGEPLYEVAPPIMELKRFREALRKKHPIRRKKEKR
jgi:hypothetical protein